MYTLIPTTNQDVFQIDQEWISPTKLRPLYQEDPVIAWLELHGASLGFFPESSTYSLSNLLETKGREFEQAWISHIAPQAQQVCTHAGQARQIDCYYQTLDLIAQQAPVIWQALLCCPSEKLYGMPDLLVHSDWLWQEFPEICHNLGDYTGYIVLDLKNTSKLQEKSKAIDYGYYQAQVRFYSYMLAQIQQITPPFALIITRDQLTQPIIVPINQYDTVLDPELNHYREQYWQIQHYGHTWRPWLDTQIAPNYSKSNERWDSAKKQIQARVPGGVVEQMWNIGPAARNKLHAAGITSLQALLESAIEDIPSGVFRQRDAMLAIMEANRSQRCIHHPHAAPAPGTYEFFVDCEFFSSINIDYQREWPELHGTPMIFMFGVGWIKDGAWHYRDFIASHETHAAELSMLNEFTQFLFEQTQGDLNNCVLYHWSHAENSQMRAAAERHNLPATHPLCNLPWHDLEKTCRTNACAIPGAWSYGLKDVATALRALDSSYDPQWPSNLNDGGMAQVIGWYAYQCPQPLYSEEMEQLRSYLEADCRATYQILRWLREYRHE